MAFAKQPPIVKTSPYTAIVPFDSKLYFAQGILTANDVLSPKLTQAKAGATAVYKLTGDGVHAPTFSSLFNKNLGSSDYDKQDGVINVITFTFDGVSFWYTLSAYATLDPPPYAVGDYGLDDTVIVVATHNVVAPLYRPALLAPPTGYVSVFDVLSSVHYKGIRQLQYSIRINGGTTWTTSPNAKDAKIVVDCDYLGAMLLDIRVGDGALMSEIVTARVTFQDTANLCGA